MDPLVKSDSSFTVWAPRATPMQDQARVLFEDDWFDTANPTVDTPDDHILEAMKAIAAAPKAARIAPGTPLQSIPLECALVPSLPDAVALSPTPSKAPAVASAPRLAWIYAMVAVPVLAVLVTALLNGDAISFGRRDKASTETVAALSVLSQARDNAASMTGTKPKTEADPGLESGPGPVPAAVPEPPKTPEAAAVTVATARDRSPDDAARTITAALGLGESLAANEPVAAPSVKSVAAPAAPAAAPSTETAAMASPAGCSELLAALALCQTP